MYATAASIERLKPPGRRAFLPWLLMLTPDARHLFGGRTPLPWLGGLGLAAFVGFYVAAVYTGLDPLRRPARTPLLALAGLAAVTFALGIGYAGNWLLCFPLLSLATGIVLRGRRQLGPVILTFAGSAGVIASLRGGPSDSLTVGYGTVLSGLVTAAILSLFETVAQLRATRQELARTAVEKERLRFSRDLHDLLGHTMSVVVVKAEAVRRLAPRDLEAALGQAADIEAVGRQALTEIREAVTGYREGSLDTELDRARSALDASGIESGVHRSGPPLSPQAEALLGWVVREGVTNVVRHSGAGHCEIDVHGGVDRVRLVIADNGHGHGHGAGSRPARDDGPARDVDGAGTGGRAGGGTGGGTGGRAGAGTGAAGGAIGGTGLKGLAERLSAAGGSLESGPDGRRGFRLVAELPVDTEGPMETTEAGPAGRAKGVRTA
jgi:two-component system sensor histidine kinase DesK